MNDYLLGNRITELRERAGMTQAELAEKLGVSNKAVSKWETGAAKPGTDRIRRLAALFGVSVEQLLDLKAQRKKEIHKIVLTGGPCSGKTTGQSWIENAFRYQGYAVLFVPETATELISGGVAPWTCGSNLDYQKCQMELQLRKEQVFEQAAAGMDAEKILIVCDRGAMDNRAYMSGAEFAVVLDSLHTNEIELRDRYDAVFHLVTAAKGAGEFYSLAGNQARTETMEEAAELDDRLIAAWTGHPHLRIIDNETDFEDKMRRLVQEISSFLGEPEPFEIERKYLIRYPDVAALEKLPNCRRNEIIQTYLKSAPGESRRIRQRGINGHYTYYETVKKDVSPLKRIELERRLSQDQYLALLMDADPARRPIRKDRYCLADGNQYFEIDVYPFWTDRAILEIEMSDPDEEIRFPKMLKLIREVTDEPEYRNEELAKR